MKKLAGLASLVCGILKVSVSTEERRVLEGVLSCRQSEIHGGSSVDTFIAYGEDFVLDSGKNRRAVEMTEQRS